MKDEIIVHCSDSDITSHDDIEVIDKWHKARGFTKVGYHAFIKKDGTIQQGRKDDETGAHCYGHNLHSLGVCLSGKDPAKFTDAQYRSLAQWCKDKMYAHEISQDDIVGHYKYSDKQCPNFNVDIWKEHYL